jgi:predicted nucleic acid-binding protein
MTPATSSAAKPPGQGLVLDASALVEALVGTDLGATVRVRMRGRILHAPAHLDAEVLSALGRLHRSGELADQLVATMLHELASAPVQRHPLAPLLAGAWERRSKLRLVDAFYIQLGADLGSLAVLTTDARLAQSSPLVELVCN